MKKMSISDIGKFLNRSYASIACRAKNFKLTGDKFWNEEKIRFLKDNYSKLTKEEISIAISRSSSNIKKIAQSLDIKTENYFWSQEDLDFLVANRQKMNLKDLSLYFNVSISCISSKLKKLGIKKINWTNKETEFLLNNYKNMDFKEIAVILNRSIPSITKKINYLGLIKDENRRNYAKKHGQSNTRLYHIWRTMKARCYDKNNIEYPRYGFLGIKVAAEWLDFRNFYLWSINNRYSINLTIDRIDGFQNYSEDNCRWITNKEQSNNTRRNIILEAFGEKKTIAD